MGEPAGSVPYALHAHYALPSLFHCARVFVQYAAIDSAQGIDEIAEQSVTTVCHRINLFAPRRQVLPLPGMIAFRADGFVKRVLCEYHELSNPATRRRTVCSLMTSSFPLLQRHASTSVSLQYQHVFLNLWVQKLSARFIANVPYLESRVTSGVYIVRLPRPSTCDDRASVSLETSFRPSSVHAGQKQRWLMICPRCLYLSSVPPRGRCSSNMFFWSPCSYGATLTDIWATTRVSQTVLMGDNVSLISTTRKERINCSP